MERNLEYLVGKEAAGLSVDAVLRKELKFTKHQVSSLKFRPRGILVNGQKERVSVKVKEGDRLSLQLTEEERTGHWSRGEGNLKVLYEDEDFLVVNKPAGILSHPVGGHFKDTLSNQVYSYFLEKGIEAGIRPVGRLDKDTSGAMIFAKNKIAAQRFCRQREAGIFQKEYLALTGGIPREKQGILSFPLSPCRGKTLRMQVDYKEGKEARTAYEVLDTFSSSALLKVRIFTGRTHQIRVHMAAMGNPLLGDSLYGGPVGEFERAALHARLLRFQVPFSEEKISLLAPLPEDFTRYLNGGIKDVFDDTLLY